MKLSRRSIFRKGSEWAWGAGGRWRRWESWTAQARAAEWRDLLGHAGASGRSSNSGDDRRSAEGVRPALEVHNNVAQEVGVVATGGDRWYSQGPYTPAGETGSVKLDRQYGANWEGPTHLYEGTPSGGDLVNFSSNAPKYGQGVYHHFVADSGSNSWGVMTYDYAKNHIYWQDLGPLR